MKGGVRQIEAACQPQLRAAPPRYQTSWLAPWGFVVPPPAEPCGPDTVARPVPALSPRQQLHADRFAPNQHLDETETLAVRRGRSTVEKALWRESSCPGISEVSWGWATRRSRGGDSHSQSGPFSLHQPPKYVTTWSNFSRQSRRQRGMFLKNRGPDTFKWIWCNIQYLCHNWKSRWYPAPADTVNFLLGSYCISTFWKLIHYSSL